MTVQSIDGHRIRKVKVRKIQSESVSGVRPLPTDVIERGKVSPVHSK